MGLNWTRHVSPMRLHTSSNLLCDGKRLTVQFGGNAMSSTSFQVTELAVEYAHDSRDSHAPRTVRISIEAFNCKFIQERDIEEIVTNLKDLSVNDLLALVHRKMEKRQSD